ncbi:unnamed protein product [Sphacelaria rigidula]
MGVHVTFVRSTELDKWKPSEMEIMKRGGNGNARAFFRAHGITDMEKTEQKYNSRAAQMYRSHLKKIMSDPAQEAPPSPHADKATDSVTCGLDRLLLDADGGREGSGQANGNGAVATAAAVTAEETQSQNAASFLAQTSSAPTKTQSAPNSGSAEAQAIAAAKAAAAVSAVPQEVQARGSLMVPAETAAPVVATPAVTLSSKSPTKVTLGRKAGPKKMGARKLGAMKLGSGAGSVKLSEFHEPQAAAAPTVAAGPAAAAASGVDADLRLARQLQEEEDARANGSSLLAAATADVFALPPAQPAKNGMLGAGAGGMGSMYSSSNDSTSKLGSGGSHFGYGYGNGGSNSSTSAYSGGGGGGSSSASFDKDKYKNVKGIGSDMLFGAQDDDPAEQQRRTMKAQEYSSSAAISSDMYFDRSAGPGMRGGDGGGDGLGGMADQLRYSAATELQDVARGVAKLKVCPFGDEFF